MASSTGAVLTGPVGAIGAGPDTGCSAGMTRSRGNSRCAGAFRGRLPGTGAGSASVAGRAGRIESSASEFGRAPCVSPDERAFAAGAEDSADAGSGKPNPGAGSGKLQGSTRRKLLRSGAGIPRRLAFPRTAFAERFSLTPMTSGWMPVCRHRIRRLVSVMDQHFALGLRNGRSCGVRNPSRARLRSSAARVRSR